MSGSLQNGAKIGFNLKQGPKSEGETGETRVSNKKRGGILSIYSSLPRKTPGT